MLINIKLDSLTFVEALAHDLRVGRLEVVEAVESVLRDQLKQFATKTLADRSIKPVTVELHATHKGVGLILISALSIKGSD